MPKLLAPEYGGVWSWEGELLPSTILKLSDGREVSLSSLITLTNGDVLEWLDEQQVEKHLAGQHDQKTHGHGKVGGEFDSSVRNMRKQAQSFVKVAGEDVVGKVPESQEEFDKWALQNTDAIMSHINSNEWNTEMMEYYRSQGVKDDVLQTYIAGDYQRTEYYLDNLHDANAAKIQNREDNPEIKTVNSQIDQAVEKGQVTIAIAPEVLGEVFEDGKLKNQFQTGTSRGLYDERKRISTEYVTQNIDIKTKDGDRPIYGFVSIDGVTAKNGPDILAVDSPNLNHYGRWRVVLNDEIKSHTSITINDSFGVFGNSQSMTEKPSKAERVQMGIFGDSVTNSSGDSRIYIETQTRGGIKSSDIKTIYAPASEVAQAQAMVESSGLNISVVSLESVGANG
jgi:hypothetical protein